MNFLSPIFLFGLFSLPIPFLIHLWHRHRLKRIWFPSISLLKSAERGAHAFRKLKDILLLVVRTLVLLFLILGFANPTLFRRQKIAILDDSWNMQTLSGSHTLFEIGEKKAHELKDTKTMLASGSSYPSRCKYQKFSLPTEGVDYIITKAGKWSAPLALPDTKLPEVIELKGDENNFSIDSFAFNNSFLVFVTNHTPQERKKLITLNCSARDTALQTLNSQLLVPPHSTGTVVFPMFSSECAGTVKIEEEDALSLDNTRYFVYAPPPELKVLLVCDSVHAFFLKNALSPPGGVSKIQVKLSPALIAPSNYDIFAFLGPPTSLHKKSLFVPIDAPEVQGFVTLDKILDSHPIFSGFKFIPELKQVKFTNVEAGLTPPPTKAGTVVASFSDGSPAILEPEPQVLRLAFPLNRQSEELILSPLFVPLMHRIAYYLSGKPIEEHNFVVGEPVRFKVPEFKSYNCVSATQTTLLTPKIEADGIYVYFTPEAPGIYEIEGMTKFAVNLSNSLVYPLLEIEHLRERVSVKKWFFIFALLLLIAEIIIRRV